MPSNEAMELASKWVSETITLKDTDVAKAIATKSLAQVVDTALAKARLEGAKAMQEKTVDKLSSMMERDTWTGYAAETIDEFENPATLTKEPCKFYFVSSVRRTLKAICALDPQQVINEGVK